MREAGKMRVLIVSDSFKGCCDSKQTGAYIRDGIVSVFPDCQTRILPVADGGEGTVDALVSALGGTLKTYTVSGPLGTPVEASFGLLPDGWAVIEMAQASGLPLMPPGGLDPLHASTYGTGELILHALDLGCTGILMGLGGSATNDGGMGMACALGARFLDAQSNPLPPGGGALIHLKRIDCSHLDPRIAHTDFQVASDVTNPLCGPQGASYVYGPQKGADPDTVVQLDAALANYAQVLQETFGTDCAQCPGAGAAGGLGAGMMSFCHARLSPGIEVLFQRLGVEQAVSDCDLIFTGEGRVDATSANGKLLSGIGALARSCHKSVIALTGSIGPGADELEALGISAVVPLADGPMTLEQSLTQAPRLITQAAARAARLVKVGLALG